MYMKSIIIEHVQIMIQMKILIDFERNCVISAQIRLIDGNLETFQFSSKLKGR